MDFKRLSSTRKCIRVWPHTHTHTHTHTYPASAAQFLFCVHSSLFPILLDLCAFFTSQLCLAVTLCLGSAFFHYHHLQQSLRWDGAMSGNMLPLQNPNASLSGLKMNGMSLLHFMKQRLTKKWTIWTLSPTGPFPVRGSTQGRTSYSSWNKGFSERRQDEADSPYLGSPNVFHFCVCFFPQMCFGN